MKAELEHIKLEAMTLPEGEWSNVECPFCKATHEKKMGVLPLPDKIAYKCLRVSCGASGVIQSGRWTDTSGRMAPTFKPSVFEEPTATIPVQVSTRLFERYELTANDTYAQGWKWAPESYRLVMPVYAVDGTEVATTLKRLDATRGKVMTLWAKDAPRVHYPITGARSTTAVVVEDQISAAKVSHLLSSVALLGTELSEKAALDLAKRYKRLIFMLDNDATDKAVKLAKEWSCLFKTQIIPMNKDPKDTTFSDLEEILK